MPTSMYDETLKSDGQYQWVEKSRDFKIAENATLRVLAHGAYNAYGLIGPELGGIAVVHVEKKFTVGVRVIPYSLAKRKIAFDEICKLLPQVLKKEALKPPLEKLRRLCRALQDNGYRLTTAELPV